MSHLNIYIYKLNHLTLSKYLLDDDVTFLTFMISNSSINAEKCLKSIEIWDLKHRVTIEVTQIDPLSIL